MSRRASIDEVTITSSEETRRGSVGNEDVSNKASDVIWVDWNAHDPEDPRNWSRARKWIVVGAGIAFCLSVSTSVSAYSISSRSIQETFNCSKEVALLGVTTFTIGFAIVPLILAPLSEIYGRSKIYLVTATLFSLLCIPEALTPTIAGLLVSRFFSGCVGSAALSVVAGTIVDCFSEADRGVPMSVYSIVAFGSPSLGSVIFGYVAQLHGIRLINWILLAMSSSVTLVLFFVLKETRGSVILARRAARLRAETGNPHYRSVLDKTVDIKTTLRVSLQRPLHMLVREPVLLSFTCWISFTWAVLYLSLVSVPIVYENTYGFGIGATGLIYLSQVLGVLLGAVFDRFCNRYYKRNLARKGPEARLYTGLGAAVFTPIGSFLWAFTTYPQVHWLVPCIGMTILYVGMFCCFLATHAYLADAYSIYAASAIAAMLLCRNLVGAAVPLFASTMYERMGIQGASGLTAGLATVLSAIPVVLFRYGHALRMRSPVSQQLRQELQLDAAVSSALEGEGSAGEGKESTETV
ncbi:hypothetical protein JCM10207_007504 [Rhodosporidiobolus poonsookiae]